MVLPIIPILVVAGIGATGFALGEADEAIEATGKASGSINSLMRTTAIVGAAWLLYKHRSDLAAMLKK